MSLAPADEWGDRLRAPAPPGLRHGDMEHDEHLAAPVPAAVLVAATDEAQPQLLLTVRHAALRNHAGQIAFPGGRTDGEEGAVAAALREAEEEIALPRGAARIVGLADPYRTVTGFAVTPVVARIAPGLSFVPRPDEVDEVFAAPLAFLLDPANQVERSAFYNGRERHYLEIPWQGRRIWGATAAMLANLSRRLWA